ncbi:MAG: RidA family protein [Acidimicrobiia bacterium]|jgi:enamine deaminase RidA (YjgF/YER057c/UK114 family)|nr:RidA family protein [Acidimicrobiia bacterium]
MTQRAFSASPYERLYGFCRAIRVGDRIEVSGTAPIPQDGSAVPASAFEQMVLCGDIAVAALTGLGATVTDVVRTRMFITSAADQEEIGRAHRQVFGDASPAATMVVVAGLLDPSWKVEIEVEAQIAGETPR